MLNLRPAQPDDENLVLSWRNEPSTRAASFDTDEISPERHHEWFIRKLDDPDCAILIVEEHGSPVGQVRLDRVEPDVAEISIGLAPHARGRGLGRQALRLSLLAAPRLLTVRNVKALVKRGNAASLAAFAAEGFQVVTENAEAVELVHGLVIDPSTPT